MIVRELVTRLGFKLDDKDLSESEKRFSSLVGNLKNGVGLLAKGAAIAAAAVAAVGAGVFAVVKSTADAGDEALKTAQKIGVPVESFQRLAYAAKLADVSQEELATGLKFLSKNLIDATEGGKETTQAFKELGIEPKKYLNDTEGLFLAIADKISMMDDGARKTGGSGLKIFGKGWTQLIPLMNAGGKAIKEAGDEADLFGLIIRQQAAVQSEEFNDNLTRMGSVLLGLRNVIGGALLPLFAEAAKGMIDWYKANANVIKGGLAKFFEKVVIFLRRIWEPLSRIGAAIGRIFGGETLGKVGGFTAALELVATAIELWLTYLAQVVEWFEEIFNSSLGQQFIETFIGPIIEAIKWIFLVLDDLAAYFRGDDSLLGVMIDAAKKTVESWLSEFTKIFDWLSEKFDWLMGKFQEIKALNPLQGFHIPGLGGEGGQVQGEGGGFLRRSLEGVLGGFSAGGPTGERKRAALEAFGQPNTSFLGASAAQAAGVAAPSALPGATPTAVQNKSMTVKGDIKVQIPAGSLADEVARIVREQLDALMRQAANATGGAAI